MRIVIFGSSGFFGTKAFEILSKNHEVLRAGITEEEQFKIDAANKQKIREFLLKYKPQLIIDTIALTSSMQCEQNPNLAYSLNYLTAKNISEVAKEMGAIMIFISSSYIFDGKKGDYTEKDTPTPENEYARTKVMAEGEILRNSKSIILRVDIMYGYNGTNKKNGVFDMILSGNQIKLREPNQLRQPVFVDDLPEIIFGLINRRQFGIFNVAGPTKIKMIDFLRKLELLVRNYSKISISNEKPTLEIKIPKNATLDISKIKNLGIKTHPLDEGLNIMEKQLKKV